MNPNEETVIRKIRQRIDPPNNEMLWDLFCVEHDRLIHNKTEDSEGVAIDHVVKKFRENIV